MLAFELTNDWIFFICGVVVSLPLGLLVNWLFWRRPGSRVTWEATHLSVLERKHDRLSLRFDDLPIERLSKLSLYVHNHGPARVNDGDCEEPMELHMPSDAQIVDVVSSMESGLSLSADRLVLSVDVSPLDPKGTHRIDILHTGTKNPEYEVRSGAIRDVAGGVRPYTRAPRLRSTLGRVWSRVYAAFVVVVALVTFWSFVGLPLADGIRGVQPWSNVWPRLVGALAPIAGFALLIGAMVFADRRTERRRGGKPEHHLDLD